MIADFVGAWEFVKPLFRGVVMVRDLHPGKVVVTKKESFLVLFKRDFYHNFKFHFPHITKNGGGTFGFAQIMSKTVLDRAVGEGVDWIVFVMPDKHCYKCHVKLFKKFYEEYRTDVPYLPGEIAMPLDYFEPAFPKIGVPVQM